MYENDLKLAAIVLTLTIHPLRKHQIIIIAGWAIYGQQNN